MENMFAIIKSGNFFLVLNTISEVRLETNLAVIGINLFVSLWLYMLLYLFVNWVQFFLQLFCYFFVLYCLHLLLFLTLWNHFLFQLWIFFLLVIKSLEMFSKELSFFFFLIVDAFFPIPHLFIKLSIHLTEFFFNDPDLLISGFFSHFNISIFFKNQNPHIFILLILLLLVLL